MIATTSVPAIWALSGLFLAMLIVMVYLLITFMILYAIFWGLVRFAKVLYNFLSPNYHD